MEESQAQVTKQSLLTHRIIAIVLAIALVVLGGYQFLLPKSETKDYRFQVCFDNKAQDCYSIDGYQIAGQQNECLAMDNGVVVCGSSFTITDFEYDKQAAINQQQQQQPVPEQPQDQAEEQQ